MLMRGEKLGVKVVDLRSGESRSEAMSDQQARDFLLNYTANLRQLMVILRQNIVELRTLTDIELETRPQSDQQT